MIFLDLKQFNRHKLWCPPKCLPFVLFNHSSLFYIVLALSSAVTNLSNKILIFHDSQGATIKCHAFPGLVSEIPKFHDFPGFPWPVRNPTNFFFIICRSRHRRRCSSSQGRTHVATTEEDQFGLVTNLSHTKLGRVVQSWVKITQG